MLWNVYCCLRASHTLAGTYWPVQTECDHGVNVVWPALTNIHVGCSFFPLLIYPTRTITCSIVLCSACNTDAHIKYCKYVRNNKLINRSINNKILRRPTETMQPIGYWWQWDRQVREGRSCTDLTCLVPVSSPAGGLYVHCWGIVSPPWRLLCTRSSHTSHLSARLLLCC